MKRKTISLADFHLYNSKIEYLIKLVIWIISWIGGIYVTRFEIDGTNSTFFVFSLSLLMEFAPQILDKKRLATRIVHSVFCFMIVAILLLSSLGLFANEYNITYYCVMFVLSCAIEIFMIADCVMLWVGQPESNTPNNPPTNESADITIMLKKFEENSKTGNLGNLKQ